MLHGGGGGGPGGEGFLTIIELVIGLFLVVVREPGDPVLLVHFVSSRG